MDSNELGVEVHLLKDVAVVIETLERLGIGVQRTKTLYPSSYLMKYKNSFKIMHFKEMLLLDGNSVEISDEDLQRRNSIVKLLMTWGLVTIIDPLKFPLEQPTIFVYVLPYQQKMDWKINHKYRRNFKIVE